MNVSHGTLPGKKLHIFFFTLCILLAACPFSHAVEQLIPIYVEPGTNLIHMARDYCYSKNSWKTIARINKLKPPYLIPQATSLHIPLSLLIAEPLQAEITHRRGTVSIERNQEKESNAHPARLGAGDTLITGADGYAQLVFPDNRSARIDPGSRLSFNYLIRLTDGSVKIDFIVEQGSVVNQVEKLLEHNDSHRTGTPTSITGVRGTEYRLKTNDTQSTIETLRGLVSIHAADSAILLSKGKGTKITKGERPTPPRVLPPPPTMSDYDAVQKILPVRIPFPMTARAASCTLRICSDLGGLKTLHKITGAPDSTFVIPDIADGHYSLYLTATDNDGFESVPSGPYPFQLRTIPAAPVLSSPNNNITTWTPEVTVQWLDADSVSRYHCQLAKNSDFTEVVEEKTVTGKSYKSPELDAGSYYFRVQAIAEDGFTTLYSPPLHWTISQKPEMGKTTFNQSSAVTLNWASMGEECEYDLQVAEDRQFKRLLVDRKALSTNSYTISTHLLPGKYMVRIRGTFGDAPTPWTPPQKLTVKQDPPGWKEFFMGVVAFGFIIL